MTLEEKIEQNLKQLHTEIEDRIKTMDKKFQKRMYQKCINELNKKEYEIRKALELSPKIEKELDILLDRFPKKQEENKKETDYKEIINKLLYVAIISLLLLICKLKVPKESNITNLIYSQIENYFNQEMNITERTNKLVETMEHNDQITEEEFLIFEQLRGYFEDNSYMDYCDVYQTLVNLDVTYLSEQPTEEENIFVLARYYESIPEIKVYQLGKYFLKDILPHEYVHITGRLFDYPELSEGITELIAREYCSDGQLLAYYPKNVTCIQLLCELINPQIVLEAYSTHNSNLIVEALATNFPSENLSYYAKNLLDHMENYCANTQSDDLEFYKNNLKNIVTFYLKTCGIEEISPYFEQYMNSLMNFDTTVPDENQNIRFYFNLDNNVVWLENEKSQKILKNEELHHI